MCSVTRKCWQAINPRQAKLVADDILNYFFLFFRENKPWHFMWIQADDSHEMSRCFLWKIKKINKKLSSAVVVIGALRVNSKYCHLLPTRLNTLPDYILEESNFSFRDVRLQDLDIPRENRLIHLQTVETLIRCRILHHLMLVCTVCQLSF